MAVRFRVASHRAHRSRWLPTSTSPSAKEGRAEHVRTGEHGGRSRPARRRAGRCGRGTEPDLGGVRRGDQRGGDAPARGRFLAWRPGGRPAAFHGRVRRHSAGGGAGGIAVPASPQAPDDDVRQLLEHSGARLLVGAAGPDVTVERSLEPPTEKPESAQEVTPIGADEDIALLCYTTAARGQARGVMLSHRALLANVEQLASIEPAPVTAADRMLVAAPLFHIYGLGPGLLQCLNATATAVLADRVDARSALAACQQHRITIVLGVPSLYAELASLDTDQLAGGLADARLL